MVNIGIKKYETKKRDDKNNLILEILGEPRVVHPWFKRNCSP